MSIAGDLIRGHTDTIILARLMLRDSYGYEINKTVTQLSGGKLELKEATLYTAFRRLEDSGLIVSYWGDEAVGARRKYYKITPLLPRAGRPVAACWRSGKKPRKSWTNYWRWRNPYERQTENLHRLSLRRRSPDRSHGGDQSGNSAKHPGQIR